MAVHGRIVGLSAKQEQRGKRAGFGASGQVRDGLALTVQVQRFMQFTKR